MFRVKTLNNISKQGLAQFAKERYQISDDVAEPDAILVRSFDMHNLTLPKSVQVVGRAGAGTNNIPISHFTQQGIPVLNTPGANANAVKELVLASMLLASRNICHAWEYVRQLEIDDAEALNHHVEQHKKQFVGAELPGKTLGIIGLGNVGVQVANAACHLGMKVVGYDAGITVKNAWQLAPNVEHAEHIDQVLTNSDFISLHVPYNDKTHHLINTAKFALFKKGAILLNFAREGIVDNQALQAALTEQRVHYYICDFPDPLLKNNPRVVSLPHLGASTYEAEENCAVMIAHQLQAYLEEGHIVNSVNFPEVKMPRIKGDSFRLAVINANVPNMLAQISTVLSTASVNIIDMINKSRGDVAYTLVDINTPVTDTLLSQIGAIDGVIRVRRI